MVERLALSVVVPVYNGERFLQAALQSVARQTLPPDELIVVDDASTDASWEVLQQFRQSSPIPVVSIGRNKNGGRPAIPLNEGIDAASGDVIAVLDQDDLFAPGKLASETQMYSDDAVGFVGGLCKSFASRDDVVPLAAGPAVAEEASASRIAKKLLPTMDRVEGGWVSNSEIALSHFVRREQFLIGFPGFSFRKRLWQECGGLNESLFNAADYRFLCQLSRRSKMGFVPSIHYYRREHDANMTRHEIRRVLEVIQVLAELAEEADSCDGHGGIQPARREVESALASKLIRLSIYLGAGGFWPQAIQLLAKTSLRDLSPSGCYRSLTSALTLASRARKKRKANDLPIASDQVAHETVAAVSGILKAA